MDAALSTVAAFIIAWLLLAGSWHKLSHRSYYAAIVADYVPSLKVLAPAINLFVASVELVVAISIIVPASRQYAALAAVVLLTLYMVAMAWQLINGKRDMDCGCAGPGSEQKIGRGTLVRNALLILIAILASIPVTAPEMIPADYLLVFLTSSFALLVYYCAEQLSANRSKLDVLSMHLRS